MKPTSVLQRSRISSALRARRMRSASVRRRTISVFNESPRSNSSKDCACAIEDGELFVREAGKVEFNGATMFARALAAHGPAQLLAARLQEKGDRPGLR